MTQTRTVYFLLVLGLIFGTGQVGPREAIVPEISDQNSVSFGLTEEGFIPAWLVAGPFEQPLVGFGQAVDTDVIGEAAVSPTMGKTEQTTLVKDGKVAWKPLHSNPSGFVDFNETMGWVRPGNEPEKIWKAKTGYAFTYLDSPNEQEVILKVGSNSSLKVLLNGETVHTSAHDRNAEPDTDTVPLRLLSGRNALLIKVGQTHRNESPNFFEELRFEWGFYAKLLSPDLIPAQNISVVVQTGAEKANAELVSTFFFKEAPEGLRQRFDLVITSLSPEQQAGNLHIRTASAEHTTTLERIPFGESRHTVYLPAITAETAAHVNVALGADTLSWDTVLRPQPHYEIHLAMMSHTDIGYTNTQPVVKERHLRTLDDVLTHLEQDSSFAWTIETVWQLEQYRQARSPEQFDRLMTFVKTGRVAISPIYTNPYTGWISAEEMIRSFNKGHAYARQYDLEFNAATYNDVPGLSWLMPQVLKNAGVSFLAMGINEVYNDYRMQRNLPKVFYWEGVGSGRVLTYRTEAYNEGQTLGLEKGVDAVPLRLWERLHRLQAQGYTYHLILAVHTFGDNGGIPLNAPATVEAWNAEYAYPRIRISNIDAFAKAFQARYDNLPTLTGDWTSTWDVLYQGEPARAVRQRWVQHHLPTAEKMSTLSWLLDQKHDPLSDIIDSAYDNLLHYSGHGSGLEYGYASPKDNLTTMAYREQYVQDAVLSTEEVLERATYRLSAREESFEGEGLYVFNSLNWSRDTPVTVEFPRENTHQYRVIDLSSKTVIPSHYSGYTLRFVVRDLPPVGYKKVRLERIIHPGSDLGEELQTNDCSIANTYYRIEGDCQTGRITHIVDLKSGKTLIDNNLQAPFGSPLRADSLLSLSFETMDADEVIMYVRDERPVRLVLVTEREDHLFAQSEYILWENLDRVDVQHTINLELLASPSEVEDYSVAFPFAISDPKAAVEVLGGFMDAQTDRFPGIEHDAFAPRRSIAIHNDAQTISWAAIDSRVVRLREENAGERLAIYANLVNNFPENWNRWERNEGTLDFRFSFTSDEMSFQPAATSRFGWEVNTSPVVRYTWLRSIPAQESFMTVNGDQVVLLALKPMSDRSGVVLRLMNMNPETSAEAQISSSLFDIRSGTNFLGLEKNSVSYDVGENLARVTLAPGVIWTLGFRLPPR
ncbi:MAG: hypothetical protein OXD43_12270 [Bacteroidetes bacterium]|nr:hypothetical protein [Bacteroidota bacterium]